MVCTVIAAIMTISLALAALLSMIAAVVTAGLALAALLATMVAAVVTAGIGMFTTIMSASTGTFFGSAASWQLGSCSRISLHIVGVVTQLAHLLTQLVGIGSLRIIVDGQLRRLHIVRVRLYALEIRHVLFKFVGAFLAHTIGLDCHGLLTLGGRFALLSVRAQRNQAY